MSQAADLPDRVTRLEHEMAEVRFLATKAEKDASDCKTVLIGHTGVLNAIRDDQVEQGKKIAKLDARLGNVEIEMRRGFARVEARFDKVEGDMRQGFTRITDLMTRHIGECESDGQT